MLDFKLAPLVGMGLALVLSACATVQTETGGPYSRASLERFYKLAQWSFDGRLALTGQKDSWSANIDWQHDADKEQIRLSGPLGQGAVVIQLTGDRVTIDRGNGDVQSSAQPEEFINQQVGIFVPVHSLRYWVVGLPEPVHAFEETGAGFKQSGWLVEYRQMQAVEHQSMPRRITVTNDQVKLKLIIDQWGLGL